MTLRATRQYVDVLATGTGTVRVTRQYVEVLAPVSPTFGAADALVLSQTADVVLVPSVFGAADTLVLSQTAAVVLVGVFQAQDTLTLAQVAATVSAKRTWAVDTLILADTPSVVSVRPAANVLTLSDVVTVEHAFAGHDSLVLSDAALGALAPGHSSDTLVLSSLAERNGVWPRRNTDALALAQTAVGQRALPRAASGLLVFSDSAAASKGVVAADALWLTDYANVGTGSSSVASDALVFSDVAVLGLVKNVGVTDTLQLQTKIDYIGPIYVSASDALSSTSYTYDIATGQLVPQITGLRDAVTLSSVSAEAYALGHLLSFGESVTGVVVRADAIAAVAADVLALSDSAHRSSPLGSRDVLVFSGTMAALVSKPLHDVLAISDQAQVSGAFNLTASDTLVLADALTYLEATSDWRFVYHPFIGTGVSGSPTPPPAKLVFTPAANVPGGTFFYPATPPYIDQCTLRSPNLGNKDRLQFNRISRETRGGTLIVFADLMWPKVQVQVLTFSGLNVTEARWLLNFMANHLGLEIGYVDWEQRHWTGVITNTTEAVVQDGIGTYTASLEFEGQLT